MDSLSLITAHNVHQAIADPDPASFPLISHSPSQLADKPLPEPEHNSNINLVPDYSHSAFQPSSNDPTVKKSSLDYASNFHEAVLPLTRHFSSQLADKPLPEPLPEREHNSNINFVPGHVRSALQPAIQESSNDPAGNNITRKSSLDYASRLPEAASSLLTRHSSSLADKPLPESLPERKHNSNNPVSGHLHSAFQSAIQESPNNPTGNNITRKSSLDYASRFPVVYATPHTTDRLKGKSFFKLLSRKKKKKDDFPWDMGSLPPQTPPKESGNVSIHQMLVTRSEIRSPRMDKTLHHQRSRSMLDLSSVIFRAPDLEEDIIVAPETHSSHYLQDSPQFHPLPLQGKWARKGTIPDPEERARQRRVLQLQKEREEQALVKEEAERQRRLKLEKEMILQEEKEEEAQRLAEIEQEVSRIKLHRRRLEQAEKEEEEQQRRKIEERKQRDRKRRMEEHQRAEEWRKQKAEKVQAAAHEAAEIQRREEAKRRYKIQLAEAEVKQTKGEKDLTGWITLQSRDEVLWKRRYFKFVATKMLLYRCAEVSGFEWPLGVDIHTGFGQDVAAPLEEIDLQGNVGGLKEWFEGCYEDLEAVAFSFVVEFKNGRSPINMYADSEEEKVGIALNTLNWLAYMSKYKLLGLLRFAAGL